MLFVLSDLIQSLSNVIFNAIIGFWPSLEMLTASSCSFCLGSCFYCWATALSPLSSITTAKTIPTGFVCDVTNVWGSAAVGSQTGAEVLGTEVAVHGAETLAGSWSCTSSVGVRGACCQDGGGEEMLAKVVQL